MLPKGRSGAALDRLNPSFGRVESYDTLPKISGGIVGGVLPDPISNSEVKPSRANGTARVSEWESRSPPG
jgi:hypothetical protein